LDPLGWMVYGVYLVVSFKDPSFLLLTI
jgi:hypothetical protein